MTEFITKHWILLLLLLLGTAFTFVWTMLNRDKLRWRWYASAPLALLHTIVGVVCVVAFAKLETLGSGVSSEGVTFSLFGAIFFLPLFYFLLAKISGRKTADVFDVFTVSMAFTLLCARINCIFAGCCLGACITGTDGPRWPTREIEIGFYVIVLTILILRILKQKNHGEIFPLYMVSYGAFRFMIEFFREPGPGTLHLGVFHISHIWAILSVLLGLSIYFEVQKNHSKKPGGTKK